MIRNSIERTKKSTFLIRVPSSIPEHKGFPLPTGTGFFISKDGYFVTANHVLESLKIDKDLKLSQPELELKQKNPKPLEHIKIIQTCPQFDIALLKVNFENNRDNPLLVNKTGFSHLDIDFGGCLDGTPVYSYGFPLPKVSIGPLGDMDIDLFSEADKDELRERKIEIRPELLVGTEYLCPRITSAIISSHHDTIGPIRSEALPKWYVIDKALNYGNSGGPIILVETGEAIAVCAKFQPVSIPQTKNIHVTVPSLYSIASSLANIKGAIKKLIKNG